MAGGLVPLLHPGQLAGSLGCLLANTSVTLTLIFIFSPDFIDGISLCCFVGWQRAQTRRLMESLPGDPFPVM